MPDKEFIVSTIKNFRFDHCAEEICASATRRGVSVSAELRHRITRTLIQEKEGRHLLYTILSAVPAECELSEAAKNRMRAAIDNFIEGGKP